jgi:NAD(P)H dehydrogenase (quinone)
MKTLLVYWHPEEKSFNASMRDIAIRVLGELRHELQVSDLHAMNFDPVSDRRNFTSVKDDGYFKQQIEEMYATEVNGFAPEIATEQEKIAWCDLMIWQFPLTWFHLPAVLKGWFDRVFAMGKTYGGGKFYANGVFRGKRAMLSLTTGGAREAYLTGGFNGDIMGILRPIHRGMLEFTGFSVLAPHIVYGPAHLGDGQRKEELQNYATRLAGLVHEQPIEVGAY